MKLFYFIYKWARTLIPGEYSFCGLCMDLNCPEVPRHYGEGFRYGR